jgi:hypothetical protein
MDTTPEEAVQRAADWIQELNPDDEAKPAEGELPISEWTPPQDYELPAELADLVASIEKERAAMEAAGSQSEPLSGPALNVPIEMDQEATQAWLAQMATVHTSEAKTVALRGKGPIQNPPKWVEDGKAPPTSSLPGATAQPASAEEELPSWLRNLEDEDLIPEAAKAKAIEPPTDQLPSWLQGLEDGEITAPSADEESADQDAEIPTPADTGPLSEIPEIKIYETPEEILEVSQQSTEQYEPLIAEWLDQIKEIEVQESASEISPVEIEEAPIASAVEEDIAWAFEPAPEEANQPVLHVEETMAVEDLELTAPPQKPTDPQLVEAMFTSPEPPLAEVESLSPEPAPPAVLPEAVLPETVLPETVSIPPLPSQLSAAQNQLWRGDIDQALADYGIMVRSGLCLEEIIQDMRAALYQHPIHIGIWETLGDAYARNHCLQDALDAYTKAEELIR